MNSLDTYTAALQMLALARTARQLTNDISLSQETRLRRIEELMGDIESCVAGSNQIGTVFQPMDSVKVSAQVLGRTRSMAVKKSGIRMVPDWALPKLEWDADVTVSSIKIEQGVLHVMLKFCDDSSHLVSIARHDDAYEKFHGISKYLGKPDSPVYTVGVDRDGFFTGRVHACAA